MNRFSLKLTHFVPLRVFIPCCPLLTVSYASSFSFFQSEPFVLLTDGYPTHLPSFPSDRRSLIALEIYTTERTFVRGLEIIVLVSVHDWLTLLNNFDVKFKYRNVFILFELKLKTTIFQTFRCLPITIISKIEMVLCLSFKLSCA